MINNFAGFAAKRLKVVLIIILSRMTTRHTGSDIFGIFLLCINSQEYVRTLDPKPGVDILNQIQSACCVDVYQHTAGIPFGTNRAFSCERVQFLPKHNFIAECPLPDPFFQYLVKVTSFFVVIHPASATQNSECLRIKSPRVAVKVLMKVGV